MKIETVLKKVYKLLEKREKWIKHASAVTKAGYGTSPCSKNAYGFCLSGAVRRVVRDEITYNSNIQACNFLAQILGTDVVDYNDAPTTRHAGVLATLRKAIKLAEKEGV